MYRIKTPDETYEFEDDDYNEALANLAACAFYDIPVTFWHNKKKVSTKKISEDMAYWFGFHHKRFLNFNAWFEMHYGQNESASHIEA